LEKPEKARHCCLLAARLFQERKRVLIVVADREQEEQLDKYLWTWKKTSFIPHGRAGEKDAGGPEEPVLVTVDCDADYGADALIMVRPCPVEFVRRFPECFDFAELYDPKLQEESRHRFVVYRKAGFEPYMYQ